MPSIWDPARQAEVVARFASLTTDRRPLWGKMSAGQMLGHCTAALDMLTGRLAVAPRPGPFRNPVLRYLIIHVLPWPKGVPTAPELIMPPYQGDWAADQGRLGRALAEVLEAGKSGKLRDHPAFGKLSYEAAGSLIYRHLDHHLKQFQA